MMQSGRGRIETSKNLLVMRQLAVRASICVKLECDKNFSQKNSNSPRKLLDVCQQTLFPYQLDCSPCFAFPLTFPISMALASTSPFPNSSTLFGFITRRKYFSCLFLLPVVDGAKKHKNTLRIRVARPGFRRTYFSLLSLDYLSLDT
jgi:hypothetical protein